MRDGSARTQPRVSIMVPIPRRAGSRRRSTLLGLALGAITLAGCQLVPSGPGPTAGVSTTASLAPSPAAAVPTASSSLNPSPSGSEPAEPVPSGPIPTIADDRVDAEEGIDSRPPMALSPSIELYSRDVSIVAGEPLRLAVSTAARSYRLTIERVDASAPGGFQVVARVADRTGRDQRGLATFTNITRTARANWGVTDTLDSAGWEPGVYIVAAGDSDGRKGNAIFVVRTPVLRSDRPLFVFTALTYQAYNLWGGADFYPYQGARATRVSFDRPYRPGRGLGYWDRQDDRILRWLQGRGLELQFTTDYDLAMNPPAIAPRLLVLPRHAEYVNLALRDWVEQHVDGAGDMNVLSYGANGFYWQVRLAASESGDGPHDIVCWKSTKDPMIAIDPARTTVHWHDHPLDRPEGAVFGAQYSGVVGNGLARHDFVVNAAMPAELLAGTGWRAGTILRGLLLGEADAVFPSSGGIAIMDGHAEDKSGKPFRSSVTIRTSPAGARVFDAGTFAWADGLYPGVIGIGVPVASFDRFNRNVLAWLGFPAIR
jgi:hypothetical protein